MERKEAVRLVSRALALVFGVFALVETTYLPERMLSYVHYTNEWRSVRAVSASLYWLALYRLEAGFLFVRIAIYLLLAVVFWHCGPWVERTLLLEREP